MKKVFESKPLYDSDILSITFYYFNKTFIIELTGITKEKTKSIKHTLNGLFKIYSIEEDQRFSIDYNVDKSSIEMSGNIYNAFKMVCEQRVISEYLESLVKEDEEIQSVLDSLKFPLENAPLIETKLDVDSSENPSENKIEKTIKSLSP